MQNFNELATSRRSIRKFKDTPVATEDIKTIIADASFAPSGCNSQCWSFIAISDKDMIQRLADTVINKVESLYDDFSGELPDSYLGSKRKMVSFFTGAPVVIAVFMTHLEYYDPLMIQALKGKGMDDEAIMKLFAHPDILSIGAAVQNLLLSAHEKGLGACWMNEPAIAAEEIRELLGEPIGHTFMSLIPIGYPAYSPRGKSLKSLDEVFRTI